MPDKPILIFPAATVGVRAMGSRQFRPPGPRPSQAEQKARLAGRFKSLDQRFGEIQADVGGVDPEQVIVFETIGSVADFQAAVKKIRGMEWLGDFDAEIADPAPGFLADGSDSAPLSGHLFVLLSNRAAYQKILQLWRAWNAAADEKLERGWGALATVFKHLHDVRAWGAKDRVRATGVELLWERGLAANQPSIRFEAELWCRSDSNALAAAYDRLKSIITSAGGQCLRRATVPEIDYDGVLLELPAPTVRDAVDALRAGGDTRLLRLTDVKYFAPMGQACPTPLVDGVATPIAPKPLPTADPVVALLDGLPLTNHAALKGRLAVDDPDNFAGRYRAGEQRHGTAMASLIAHGELDAGEPALASRLYVRPLMHPQGPEQDGRRDESFPATELTVDLVHRAVKRMLEGESDNPPQAPSVKVINLSVGDLAQPFDRRISPWARLVDWLAWKYQVLFVISAGNHLQGLTIPAPQASIPALSDESLRSHTLRAMSRQRVDRRLLAPAESVNALTIGALHAQVAPTGGVGSLVDLLRGAGLPSPISSVASGFRRSLKPEILVPGGRRHYMPKLQPGTLGSTDFELSSASIQPGQLVASPGGTAVPPAFAVRSSGTSNAAALTSRRAAYFMERIDQLRLEPGGDLLTPAHTAVILKAMLVHGAGWGDWESVLDQVFDGPDTGLERWWRIKRACGQMFGYGIADFERGTVCTDQRVILLGCGELPADKGHAYQIPLPPVLSAQTVRRRLTITLAWLTPIHPRHRNYCGADLSFDPPESQLQVKRREADHKSVRRGTVQHEVLEGDAVVAIADGDMLPIQVNCRSEVGRKFAKSIPYALMVSLETAEPLGVSVYEQVRVALERVREAVRVRATVHAGRAR